MKKTNSFFGKVGIFFKTMFSSEIRDRVTGCCSAQSEEVLQDRIKRDAQREKERQSKTIQN